jgi:hypothetical protein
MQCSDLDYVIFFGAIWFKFGMNLVSNISSKASKKSTKGGIPLKDDREISMLE